ncbi:MAG: ABC transporter ATP-binding protein [Mariniblastus sp.]|nr:ABC transporter ATP-binding protein [Mariniblastus sp.]
MKESPAIQADGLSKTYSEGLVFRKRFAALKDVSFTVLRGEVYGLLGPNGAGKTTFLKILLGIISKSSGQASMMGFPAGSRAGRRLVGYLPEHLRIPPHMTGYTALECYGNLSNVSNRVIREKRDGLLELVGLADRAKDRCKNYSKGMLQRLGLAQTLLHDPQLVVLDEPTDGLDPGARAEMRDVIHKLAERGVTIFLNSHLLHEVEMTCKQVAILDRGNLRYSGSVNEIGDYVNKLTGEGREVASIEITVSGDPEAIHESFADRTFEILNRIGANEFAIRVESTDQAATDQLIDRLRSNDVSLIELACSQVSLEDAFLKIVEDGNAKP